MAEQGIFKPVKIIAVKSGLEQKPSGICPYVGVLVYLMAEYVRYCKLSTSICIKTVFSGEVLWGHCSTKLGEDVYLYRIFVEQKSWRETV